MSSRALLPRISIGLPVYNGAEFLESAIDSLLAQDVTDFELIISDNASSDRTQTICERYVRRDPRVRYSRNERNLGPNLNFLRALELATGKYFMWASHDDLWSPNYVRGLAAGFDGNDHVVLVAGRTIYVDQTGSLASMPPAHAPRPGSSRAHVAQLLGEHATSWFYGLYQRATLIDLMEFLRGVPVWGGDILFLVRCCLRYEVAGDDEAVIYKRLRLDNSHAPSTPRAWVRWQATFTTRLFEEVMSSRQPWNEKLAVLADLSPHVRRLVFRKGAKGTALLWLRAAYQLSQHRDHA